MTDRKYQTAVTKKCNFRLLRWETVDDRAEAPTLQLVFTLETALSRMNSRDAPTARKELVIAVIPLIIEAINDIFSSIKEDSQ